MLELCICAPLVMLPSLKMDVSVRLIANNVMNGEQGPYRRFLKVPHVGMRNCLPLDSISPMKVNNAPAATPIGFLRVQFKSLCLYGGTRVDIFNACIIPSLLMTV